MAKPAANLRSAVLATFPRGEAYEGGPLGVPMILTLEPAGEEPQPTPEPAAMADLVLNAALVGVAEACLGGDTGASPAEVAQALEVAAEFCLVVSPYRRRVT